MPSASGRALEVIAEATIAEQMKATPNCITPTRAEPTPDRPRAASMAIEKPKPLLFPITSQPPATSTRAVQIPDTEARRANLYTPAWVIVDEFNTDDLATSWAVEDAKPPGQFSRRFTSRIAAEAAAAIRAGATRSIPQRYLRDLTRRTEQGEFSLGPMLMAQLRANSEVVYTPLGRAG